MQQPDLNQLKSPPSTPSKGCLARIVFILVWLWIIVVVFGRIATQLTLSSAVTLVQDPFWALFPAIQGMLLLLPLLPLAWLWRSEPWLSIYRTWLYASLYVLLLAPVSLLFPGASQMQALLNTLLSLLAAALLFTISRRRRDKNNDSVEPVITQSGDNSTARASAFALVAAVIFAVPWVLVGALGSPLDTLLGALSGLAFGLASAAGLLYILERGLREAGFSPYRRTLLGGFAAGVSLLIFSSGVGYPFGGMQLLLAVCIPTLGWLAVFLTQLADAPSAAGETPGLARPGAGKMIPVMLLLGLAASFPQALIDPDELALVISAAMGEILIWAMIAASASAVMTLLLSAILLIRLRMPGSEKDGQRGYSLKTTRVAALVAWLVLLAVYFFGGQPGFYGEMVFAILNEQADLSAVSAIPDPDERREQVFQTLVQKAEQTQAGLRQDLSRFGIQHRPYYLVNGLEVQGGLLVRLWLQNRPEVDRVLYSPTMRPLRQTPPTATGSRSDLPDEPLWNLTQINAPRVWQELSVTGEGVVIGQSDSGVQFDHPELADSYRGWKGGNGTSHDYNWFDPWNGTAEPVDIGGHGTHTLGSALGNSTGVAPGAQWIACVNLARNLGSPARYLDCMQFMLAPFPIGADPFIDSVPALGANVLNNSWGCPEIEGCDLESLQPAVSALDAAGIFVVASAGNDGPFCGSLSHPLAIYQTVYAVGASDSSGALALFSSRGPTSYGPWVKPDIVAPGDQVVSAMPGSTYGTMSGTSMAGPHVAGAVALMWSANPALIGDTGRTREILARSAQSLTFYPADCAGASETPSTAVGYGLLDAYQAVRAALDSP